MNIKTIMSLLLVYLYLAVNDIEAQIQDTSFTLESAVQMGLKNNMKILAAQKDIAAAKGRAITTLGIEDPTVSGEWLEIPTGKGISQYGERDFSVTQSIDFPTNYIHKKKLGDLDIQREQLILKDTELFIRTEIEKAYYNVLSKKEQLNLVRQHIKLAQQFLDKAQTRYNSGKAPFLEVSRARLALANVENELSVAKSDFQTAMGSLNTLLAMPDNTMVIPLDTLDYKMLSLNESDLTKQALASHPELKVAKLTEKMAGQDLNLAKGSYLPNIEGSYFSQKIGGSKFNGVGLGLSIPLWFPANQRGKVMQSRGYLEAAQYRTRDQEIILQSAIKSTFAQVVAAREQVEKYLGDLLEQTQSVYDMTFRSYEEGKVDYLKVLDAQQLLIENNRRFIDAIAGYKMKIAELERVTNQNIIQ